MKRQSSFGWLVAADVFLGGAAGGLFFISFVMNLLNRYEPLARMGAVIAPVLMLAGALALFLELGTKSQVHRLFSNTSSWMTRGTFFVMVFVLFSLAYALPAFRPFAFLPWDKTTLLGKTIGWVAALAAILVMLYTGLLFGVIKRVPLWNTPVLPLLFFFSSLYTGMAVMLLMASSFLANPVGDFNTLAMAEIVLIFIQLLLVGTFLWIGGYGSSTAAESVRLLRRPLFSIGVLVAGLLIPLGLLFYSRAATGGFAAAVLAGWLLLAGGFILRYCVIKAGVRLPLYPP